MKRTLCWKVAKKIGKLSPIIFRTILETTQMQSNHSNNVKPTSFLPEDRKAAAFPPTYPTARLLSGISAVGVMNLLCLALLATGVFHTLIPMVSDNALTDFLVVLAFVLAYAMIMSPLDFITGHWIPGQYGRPVTLKLRTYLKGSLLHCLVLGSSILILHGAGQIGGLSLAALLLILIFIFAIRFQLHTAICVGVLQKMDGPCHILPDLEAIWVESKDPCFSGGIVGLPGREQIILPSKWYHAYGADFMRYLHMRRQKATHSGWRSRGMIFAGAWVLMSFLLSAYLVGFPEGGLISTLHLSLLSSVFHFLGLLILPTPSRRATLAIDHWMQQSIGSEHAFKDWIQKFSNMTDGEVQRGRWIERIFHPIPAVQNRLHQYRSTHLIGWNSNRMMLYFSIFSGGLMSRAVHCNIGKPELWIMAPAD